MFRRRNLHREQGDNSTMWVIGLSVGIAVVLFALLYGLPQLMPGTHVTLDTLPESVASVAEMNVPTTTPVRVATHLQTPRPLRGIYMSSWVAGSPSIRSGLVKLMDDTEVNAVVIDIKDYSGRVSFLTDDQALNDTGSPMNRISDVKDFIDLLHSKNIYVIGRISVFQDSFMVGKHPEWAVKRASDGGVWKDRKGISWIDVSAQPFWDYIVNIADYSYTDIGFDELNFDYIRFPSDGDMKDISYPYSGTKKKSEALKDFFAYLHQELQPGVSTSTPFIIGTSTEAMATSSRGVKIVSAAQFEEMDTATITHYPKLSADLFGMTTSNHDDLNIGQLLENALPYFDYIAPMVYPSHYPATFLGYQNPSAKPYEVVNFAMSKAVERAIAMNINPLKLRPWLQDFSIGTTLYTPEMVRAQMQATYDSGLDSWLLWSAANRYSLSALEPSTSPQLSQ